MDVRNCPLTPRKHRCHLHQLFY